MFPGGVASGRPENSSEEDFVGMQDQVSAAPVKDTTTASFRADVIAESARQPVLVDFWAPWCGPCKQLGPVLEKAVQAANGKVKLVKMNIDDHPQIPGQLGIQSIPAVIAFQRGQPVDGFLGNVPESQVKAFIERLVGPLGPSSLDTLLAEADDKAAKGDFGSAAELYGSALAQDEGNLRALGGLIRVNVESGALDDAKRFLAMVPAGKTDDAAISAARAALELAEQAANAGDLKGLEAAVAANPLDHQARFDLAVALNAKGEREAAIDQLISIIKRDRAWNDDGARKQLLQFFEAWGPMDETTKLGRRKLSSVLFS
jgi:putative thioredoxin